MRVIVLVWIKPEFKDKDPVAKDHKQRLLERGMEVTEVRTGKHFILEIDTVDPTRAQEIAIGAAERLLANPTNETYEIVSVGDKK